MDARWIKGTQGEAKEKRLKELKSYSKAFGELEEMLSKHFLKDGECRNYSSPNWMAEQIALNERNSVIRDIIKFIKM